MSDVTRYDLDGGGSMEPSEDGAWVYHDDYDALRAQLSEAQARLAVIERQEPVAWRVLRTDGAYELFIGKDNAQRRTECFIRRPSVEPLYAAPAAPAAQAVDVADICNAYESGVRHRGRRTANINPYAEGTHEHEAYAIGAAGKPAAHPVADDVVRDAERYRFLRDNEMQWWVATGHWRISRHGSIIAEGVHKNYEAAVDAAILAVKQQKAGGE